MMSIAVINTRRERICPEKRLRTQPIGKSLSPRGGMDSSRKLTNFLFFVMLMWLSSCFPHQEEPLSSLATKGLLISIACVVLCVWELDSVLSKFPCNHIQLLNFNRWMKVDRTSQILK